MLHSSTQIFVELGPPEPMPSEPTPLNSKIFCRSAYFMLLGRPRKTTNEPREEKSGSREEKSWSLIHVRSYSERNGVFWFTAPVILCLDLLRNLGNCLIQWKIQSQRLNKPRRNFFNKWTMSRKSHWKSARLSATCRFKTPSSYRWVPAQARAAQFKGKSRHFVVFTSKIDRSSIFLQFFFCCSRVYREQLSLSLISTRTRRFSCSSNSNGPNSGIVSPGPRLAPRITQLRQEECIDIHNREAQSEREIHSALSISQSYEDLTLVLNENCFFKNNDEFSNPLHVTLPLQNLCPSSPSPTRFVSTNFKQFWAIVDALAGSRRCEGHLRSFACDTIHTSAYGDNFRDFQC